jgi:hypothetical protein
VRCLVRCGVTSVLLGGCSSSPNDIGTSVGGVSGGGLAAIGGQQNRAGASGSASGSGGVSTSGGASGSAGGSVGGDAGSALAGSAGAGGNGGAVGGGASEPRPAVPGSVLWLEADASSMDVEAEHVAQWRDLSDAHNDATQASSNVRPALVAATAIKPAVVHFTAQQHTFLGIADAVSLQWGKQDFTVALVFAFTNQPFAEGAPGAHLGGWGFALNKITQPSGPRLGWGIMGNWPNGETVPVRSAVGCETTEAGGSLLSKKNGYNDGALRLWVMRRATAKSTVELRDNGVVDGSAKGGPFMDDVTTAGTPLTLGGARLNPSNMTSAAFNLEGDIAAVVAIKGELSDANLALLEQYLMKKYRVAAQ